MADLAGVFRRCCRTAQDQQNEEAQARIKAMEQLDQEFDIYRAIKRDLKRLPKRKRRKRLDKLRALYFIDWKRSDRLLIDLR